VAKIWVGIGCQRGITSAEISEAIEFIFTKFELPIGEIVGMATIDCKVDEMGLIEYCRDRHLSLLFYDPDSLASMSVENPSDRVAGAISTPSVAEAAALIATNTDRPIVPKQNYRCQSGRSISISIGSSQA
jgi:cobalt-precorrin 5A hydrolase / precorrin-3B C17-methyltransferase